MFVIVTIVHIIACLFLIGVVLLQQGKGADMGAVFGGSSSTIFGSSGAGNFLTRLTTAMAVVFMLTSLTLTYASTRRISSTVFDSAPLAEPPPLGAPANPAAPAPVGGAPQAEAPAGSQPAAVPAGEPPAAAPQAAAPPAPAPQAPAAQAPAAQAAAPEAAAPAPGK
jgi:preprotein translocase subunit SecG